MKKAQTTVTNTVILAIKYHEYCNANTISVEIACVQAGDSKLRCVPCVTHYDEHLSGISFCDFCLFFLFLWVFAFVFSLFLRFFDFLCLK